MLVCWMKEMVLFAVHAHQCADDICRELSIAKWCVSKDTIWNVVVGQVWAIFAPKLVWEVATLATVDLVLLFRR